MRRIAVVEAFARMTSRQSRAARRSSGPLLHWVGRKVIAIDYHWIANDPAFAQKTAVEVIALAPDVLLASSNFVIAPLSKATRTIPIVMVQVIDPVGSGYVESMARPSGNIRASHSSSTASLVSGSIC